MYGSRTCRKKQSSVKIIGEGRLRFQVNAGNDKATVNPV